VGPREELGITVALIPTHLRGVEIGRRHLPSMQVFQNGPNRGHDVSSFRWITSSAARHVSVRAGKIADDRTCRRARHLTAVIIRSGARPMPRAPLAPMRGFASSFNVPIGKFEGIEEPLARIAGTAYLLDAARRLTCAALNQGHHPAVISGIMKLHATERMRVAFDDAMDIHGGKAVMTAHRITSAISIVRCRSASPSRAPTF